MMALTGVVSIVEGKETRITQGNYLINQLGR